LRSRRRAKVHSESDLLPVYAEDGHQKQSSPAWYPPESGGIYPPAAVELVRAKVDELPEALRETVVLRDCLGCSTEETAVITGVSKALVKTRLHRARQALRTLLEPHLRAGGHEWAILPED